MPPEALRLESVTLERLAKLGLQNIGSFVKMPTTALRRRFGQPLLTRINQALGSEMEILEPVQALVPFQERLPSLEPIRTAPGIEIALRTLLEMMCLRLSKESKGLRKCELRCYRVDGNVQRIEIGTNRPSRNTVHLFKLFEIKISSIEPDLGIELFILEAPVVEELLSSQDALWTISSASDAALAELLDRLAGKTGGKAIHRYLPDEHFWPERSLKEATSLSEKPSTTWQTDFPRPLHLLSTPELIEVSVPVPDYPPLLFKYKGVLHTVKKQTDQNALSRNGGSRMVCTAIIIVWKMRKARGIGCFVWAIISEEIPNGLCMVFSHEAGNRFIMLMCFRFRTMLR